MSLDQPWICHGDFELNYGCSCGLPTLVPSSGLEQKLRVDRDPTEPTNAMATGAVVVHIHAYHLDELGEILDELRRCLSTFELILTTDSEVKREQIQRLLNDKSLSCRKLSILIVNNSGRNIGPLFLSAFAHLRPDDICLHLHTKRTDQRELGSTWRTDLLSSLLGSRAHSRQILTAFYDNPDLGLVMARPTPSLRPFLNWGSNFELARLISMLELPDHRLQEMAPLVFPVGMMFWFRPKALQGMARACRKLSPWPVEPLPVDGTVLHALERLTAHFCEAEGLRWGFCGPSPVTPLQDDETSTSTQHTSVWQELRETYLSATSLLAERCRRKELELGETMHEHAAKLETIKASYGQRMKETEAELAAMKATASWRITKPLRRLQQMLRPGAGT